MCGHDGHMATLLAAAQVIQTNRNKIPKNKTIRLLFQPAEEGPGGAEPMVKQGCLENVDEVYGYHNIPNFYEGDIRVVSGPIMAQVTLVKITVKGNGGHGSLPHKVDDVISAGAAILNNLHSIQSRSIDTKEHFIFTITQFSSGHTYNVFPDQAFMQGTIRSYNTQTLQEIKKRIQEISQNIAKAYHCEVDVDLDERYPAVINQEKYAQIVKKVGEKYFGKEHVRSDELPLTASEDFSYFLNERPGCFYMLGLLKPGEKSKVLHTSDYNYNDDMLASGAYLFVRIVEDRLGVNII